MSDLVSLLKRAADGDHAAHEAAYAIAYPVLKQLARKQKRALSSAQSANTTSVVNDACVRLLRGVSSEDEGHFYAIAAQAMRQILIDQARAQLTEKRGAGQSHAADIELVENLGVEGLPHVDVLALDQALAQLHVLDADLAHIVELHCLAGLDLKSVGRLLGTSERTARREWRRARAFLLVRMQEIGK